MSEIRTPHDLKAAYPYQFAKPMGPWAFAFARGWMPMIVRACEEIDALVRADKYRHRFHWVQIKEKFGTLRMYWEARGMRGRIGLGSSTGKLSLPPAVAAKNRDRLVAAKIASIVRATEAISSHSCIVCGSAGTSRERYWTLTLCEEHARQMDEGACPDIYLDSENDA